MKERMKILQLLQEGKLTAEQAELLLAALEEPEQAAAPAWRAYAKRTWSEWNRRVPLHEWRQLGSQLSTVVSQSLGDVRRALEQQKRTLEQQLELWTQSAALAVTQDVPLPEACRHLVVQTGRGRIQVFPASAGAARVHVRARVHTSDLASAQQALAAAVQVRQHEDRCEVAILPAGKEQAPELISADLDVWLPETVDTVFARLQQGTLWAEAVTAEELSAETDRGQVVLVHPNVQRVRAIAGHGPIHLQGGWGPRCRSVYLEALDGNLRVDGIPADSALSGVVTAAAGKADLDSERFMAEASDEGKRTTVRFRQRQELPDRDPVVLHLLAVRGTVQVR
ncbi:MAG: hypothetical protein K6T26_00160 [Alicyclobacillus sp.]|nr:hypothetical protein [Alicyclobacillus sp.]